MAYKKLKEIFNRNGFNFVIYLDESYYTLLRPKLSPINENYKPGYARRESCLNKEWEECEKMITGRSCQEVVNKIIKAIDQNSIGYTNLFCKDVKYFFHRIYVKNKELDFESW